MNERQWWSSHVKPRLTDTTKRWLAIKVQNYNNPGFPDALCCFDGVACLIETKFIKQLPLHESSLVKGALPSPEQFRHLAAWRDAGGIGYVLVGIEAGKTWHLFTAEMMLDYEPTGGIMLDAFKNNAIMLGGGWATMVNIPEEIMARAHAI